MVKLLTLIQGDSFDFNLVLKGDEDILLQISDIFFSCKIQKIFERLTKIDNSNYFLYLSPSRTKKLTPKISCFDITIRFDDGEILTAVFQNKLQVLKKYNEIE